MECGLTVTIVVWPNPLVKQGRFQERFRDKPALNQWNGQVSLDYRVFLKESGESCRFVLNVTVVVG